jgi:hypothetical protein
MIGKIKIVKVGEVEDLLIFFEVLEFHLHTNTYTREGESISDSPSFFVMDCKK